MPLLSIDIAEPTLALEHPYEGHWAGSAQVAQTGIPNLWLPIRDINGLSEAVTALFRAERRDFSGQLDTSQQQQRIAMLQIARKIVTAERELQVKEFAKLLGDALKNP